MKTVALIIAEALIDTIEELGIEDRCTNYQNTWRGTKNILLIESRKGKENPIFWEAVENIAKTIKEFTR
ncbi:hypothetical protein M2102_003302 [Fusobacterium sp. PH5-7]|uniref:hypothetical protein n=1 Tax=Fusobacterium sp. PH5-7 TaxID=2940528 RepID=UPI0024748CA5|nr:hypothetical protein [Fusobacterium sp. PH5-7]MDH6459640.1 hypothetical protein [Fusobacterium sp. PH5-7]